MRIAFWLAIIPAIVIIVTIIWIVISIFTIVRILILIIRFFFIRPRRVTSNWMRKNNLFSLKFFQLITNGFHSFYVNKLIQTNLSVRDRKSTRLNSSHVRISYAVFCLKKKNKNNSILLSDN